MEEEDGPPGGPGAVLSYLREGAPSSLAEIPTNVPGWQDAHDSDSGVHASGMSGRCAAFVDWLDQRGFEVIVFDMDRTMSNGHCGQGLLRTELDGYLAGKSVDFVEASAALASLGRYKLAVATGSDPLEYALPGQGMDTHILGPDLARALIQRWCPQALTSFEIMVGFDFELHGGAARDKGKRLHMRQISEHYGVDFSKMVLFDDSAGCLENEDGWVGVRVRDSVGFRFEDCFETDGDREVS